MKDRRLVQVSHVGHVFDHVELWRIHLLDLIFLEGLLLLLEELEWKYCFTFFIDYRFSWINSDASDV